MTTSSALTSIVRASSIEKFYMLQAVSSYFDGLSYDAIKLQAPRSKNYGTYTFDVTYKTEKGEVKEAYGDLFSFTCPDCNASAIVAVFGSDQSICECGYSTTEEDTDNPNTLASRKA